MANTTLSVGTCYNYTAGAFDLEDQNLQRIPEYFYFHKFSKSVDVFYLAPVLHYDYSSTVNTEYASAIIFKLSDTICL